MRYDETRQPAPFAPVMRPAAPARPDVAVDDLAAEHVPRAGVGEAHGAAVRALRNLEATEARLARNAQREADDMRGKLVQDLLPVLDNLDRTIQAAQAHGGDPALLEGVRLVHHQLEGVLHGYGAERIDALDQPFDPAIHEAIGVTAVADYGHDGVVIQQLEPGYRFAGRLLRPAKVTVGKLSRPMTAGARSFWR